MRAVGDIHLHGSTNLTMNLAMVDCLGYGTHLLASRLREPLCHKTFHPLSVLVPSCDTSMASRIDDRPTTQPPQPRPAKFFPPSKYVSIAAQVIYYGVLSRLPMIARVTMTDYRGKIILDTFVRPTQPVADFRTAETGLQAIDLASAPNFIDVQRQVAALIRDKIIVGYELWNTLKVLDLRHPAIDTRDIALFMPFRRSLGYKPNVIVPLVTLVNRFMGRNIGLHGEVPVEIARASMDLMRSCEHTWEAIIEVGSWPSSLPPREFAIYFV